MNVPILGRSPVIDLSPEESKIRKDVANLAQGILQTHACTAESAFRAAENFYRIKAEYLRSGVIPEEPTDA